MISLAACQILKGERFFIFLWVIKEWRKKRRLQRCIPERRQWAELAGLVAEANELTARLRGGEFSFALEVARANGKD